MFISQLEEVSDTIFKVVGLFPADIKILLRCQCFVAKIVYARPSKGRVGGVPERMKKGR
jgi:hypothetical protein